MTAALVVFAYLAATAVVLILAVRDVRVDEFAGVHRRRRAMQAMERMNKETEAPLP